jgi:hypothetical protein
MSAGRVMVNVNAGQITDPADPSTLMLQLEKAIQARKAADAEVAKEVNILFFSILL